MLLLAAGDLPGAERAMRDALARFGAAGDSVSDGYGRTLADLGLVLSSSGRPAEAEPLFRASAKHRRLLDSASVANAILLGNLGLVLSQQGKLDSAEPMYRLALAAYDRFRPREYFEEGWTLGNLAVDLVLRKRGPEALALAERQVAHFSRLLGARHPNVGYGWVNAARALHAMGEEKRALAAAKQAEGLFAGASFPAGHPDFARTENIQGQILTVMGRYPEAERRLRNALAIRRARLAAGSAATADVELALGELLARTGKLSEAESLLVTAGKTYRERLDASDPRIANAAKQLAELCGSGIRGPGSGVRGCAPRP
jgi:tetratricopeptide (TPR) repeat protein